MPRLGSYTTYDSPTARQAEALEFLQQEFEAIGGRVREIQNPHDFGSYPSFEIDYPAQLEDIDTEPIDEVSEEEQEQIDSKELWHEQAQAIERAYSEKFSEVL